MEGHGGQWALSPHRAPGLLGRPTLAATTSRVPLGMGAATQHHARVLLGSVVLKGKRTLLWEVPS